MRASIISSSSYYKQIQFPLLPPASFTSKLIVSRIVFGLIQMILAMLNSHATFLETLQLNVKVCIKRIEVLGFIKA